MNAQKILKNPIAVAALSVGAAGMLFLNVVLPLLSNNSETSEEASVSALPAADAASAGDAQNVATAAPNTLRIIGWKLSVTRDPFLNEKDRRNAAVTAPPERTAAPQQSGPSQVRKQPPARRAGTARRAEAPSLQAIMQGPAGTSALIGGRIVRKGDTCDFGIVQKITTNAVILTTPRGSRELRLAARNPGDTP